MVTENFLIPFKQNSDPIKVSGSVDLTGNTINLKYQLYDPEKKVIWNKGTNKNPRVIGLWNTTCFEFFLLNTDLNSYYEFNFSPEGQWNCFYFPNPDAPLLEWSTDIFPKIDNSIEHILNIEISKDILIPEFVTPTNISMGISAVIMANNGNLEHWALSHPDLVPNFHHFKSFLLKF